MIKINRKAIIVIGLGYGDEGKGSIVDYLVRKYNAHTVIRFNGGPQAAHHVIDSNGVLHCFSQFGSGTFIPGVKTFLSRFMLVDPLSLEKEGEVLKGKGVSDCFNRIAIDEKCLIVTPFHKIIGRMLEISRGDLKYGSCGMGVGQAFVDGMQMGDKVLIAGDLRDKSVALEKLKFFWMIKMDIAEQLAEQQGENIQLRKYFEELAKIDIEQIGERYNEFWHKVKIVSSEYIANILRKEGAVIFEGAQGALLDNDRGFYPYVTRIRTTFVNAEKILEEIEYDGDIYKLGVLRAYGTRHGAGPFVAEDENLAKLIPDMHNGVNEWQGKFRIGWLDLVAMEYALGVTCEIKSATMTNIDRLESFDFVSVCVGYSYAGDFKRAEKFFNCEENGSATIIKSIKIPNQTSREYQHKLAELLYNCQPIYEKIKKEEFVHFIEDRLKITVSIKSVGPKARDKVQLATLY